MRNELVNAVQCAKIITNEFNRKVDRTYITRLANENRIPYEVFEGKKLFNPQYVLDNLPAERLVASKFEDEVTQLKIIDEAIASGVKVNFNNQRPKKLFSNPTSLYEHLPFIEELTIEDIRKALKKMGCSKEEMELVTDDIIKKQLEENKVDFKTLDNFWRYHSDFEQSFKESYNKEIRYFSFDDEIKLFYLIMWQFPRADFIADWCLEETLD
jgi:hypothetical protein